MTVIYFVEPPTKAGRRNQNRNEPTTSGSTSTASTSTFSTTTFSTNEPRTDLELNVQVKKGADNDMIAFET